MEFAVPAWSPWLLGDIDKLESVQEQAIGMISGLNGRSYAERLAELGLSTLRARREKFDMVETYKIIKGGNRVHNKWFKLAGTNPGVATRNRSYHYNIIPVHSRGDVRKNFFSQRVCSSWNVLPEEIKDATSVDSFKRKYEKWCKMSVHDQHTRQPNY